jgi:hypothetical protein
MNEYLDSLIEVKIAEEEDFLKIKETLTRIGVASRKEKKLFQSCHIFPQAGKYYIIHLKKCLLLMVSHLIFLRKIKAEETRL